VRALLDRYGLTEEIGHEHFYDLMQDVIEAYQQKVIEANQGRPTTPGTGSG